MANTTKKHNHKFKKASAMAAASFMIISLVLGGCGSAASSQTSAAAAQSSETQVQKSETQVQTSDDAQDTDAAVQSSDASAPSAGSESTASSESDSRSSEALIEDITGNITETIENRADGEHGSQGVAADNVDVGMPKVNARQCIVFAGVAADADDLAVLDLDGELAAQGAVDAGELSCLHG